MTLAPRYRLVNSALRIGLSSGMLSNERMDVEETRRLNLLTLIALAGGQRELAERLKKNPAQISQWVNRSPDSKTGKPRVMSSGSARAIEKALAYPRGWLDEARTNGDAEPVSRGDAMQSHPDVPRGRRVTIRGNAVVDRDGFWEGEDADVGFVEWEATADAFAVQIATDALDPVLKRGTILVLDSSDPVPGELVELALADGRHALLEFVGRHADHWVCQSLLDRRRMSFPAQDVLRAHAYAGQLPGHKRRTASGAL